MPAIVIVVVAEVTDEGIGIEPLVAGLSVHAQPTGHLARGDAVTRADELVHRATERVGRIAGRPLPHVSPPQP